MSPADFTAAGEALFGPVWQSVLARALGRSRIHIVRLARGERAVPPEDAAAVLVLLRERRAVIAKLLAA